MDMINIVAYIAGLLIILVSLIFAKKNFITIILFGSIYIGICIYFKFTWGMAIALSAGYSLALIPSMLPTNR